MEQAAAPVFLVIAAILTLETRPQLQKPPSLYELNIPPEIIVFAGRSAELREPGELRGSRYQPGPISQGCRRRKNPQAPTSRLLGGIIDPERRSAAIVSALLAYFGHLAAQFGTENQEYRQLRELLKERRDARLSSLYPWSRRSSFY